MAFFLINYNRYFQDPSSVSQFLNSQEKTVNFKANI